jgi:DNA-binding NtrC family response regulator
MKNPIILIAAGDDVLRQDIQGRLSHHGFALIEAPDKTDLLQCLQRRKPDLIIIGSSRESTKDGLNVVEQIRERDRKIPIFLVTRHSSEARAIAALRAGINDFFKWPLTYKELVAGIRRNLPDHKTYLPGVHIDNPMIGDSAPMQEIKDYVPKVAATDSTVLITGETGTGKELAAELIHRNSPRHKKPFVCVNCAALPENLVESELFGYYKGAFTGAVETKEGKFAMAGGGSVFLDEIGDMHPYAQAKILRSIESKEVYPLGGKGSIPLDVRIIAATNQDPEQLLAEGKFREDLYYRLNVARIHLPPLRDRKEDIPELIAHAIDTLNRRFRRNIQGLTEDAMTLLLRYHWPGNVRELQNLLEAAFINLPNSKIAYADLPKQFKKRFLESEKLPTSERKYIVSALLETNWNKSTAAQKLSWSRMTLYRKIAKYNIVEKRNR